MRRGGISAVKTGGLAEWWAPCRRSGGARGRGALVLPGSRDRTDCRGGDDRRVGPAWSGAADHSPRCMPDTAAGLRVDALAVERKAIPMSTGRARMPTTIAVRAFGWAAAHLAFGEFDPSGRANVLHCHDWLRLGAAYLHAHPDRRVRTLTFTPGLPGRFPWTIRELAFRRLCSAPRVWSSTAMATS